MFINYENGTQGYLDITFGPKWDYVPLTKNYVENFLIINLVDKVNIGKIAMSASELLENAVKYSSSEGIRMIIKKQIQDERIELEVFNYCDKENATKLKQQIKDMNETDPLEFYINKMKTAATLGEGESGLGLARINYEGGAEISIDYVEESKIIIVKASFQSA